MLLLDNIDILFDRLKEQAWSLRELLSRESGLLVVGASASHPEETYTYEAPFYDFFKVHELSGLPAEEARRLILHLSDLRGAAHVRRVVEAEPARIRTLHTLSGGNPRTLMLLYFVLMQSTEGDAATDLERLLDHITPLYKARIEALSGQTQKILDAVAVYWHPIPAAEVARRTQLDVGVVSSQLTRLLRDGVLERSPTPEGTKSAYQVAERLLNIWYLMRQSRRVRQRLVWLVEFLRMFYGSQELASHARAHLDRIAPAEEGGRIRHAEYRLALAEAVDDAPLRHALESAAMRVIIEDPALRERISRIVDLEGADASLKPVADKHRAAAELWEDVLAAKVIADGWNAAQFAELLGGSLSLSRDEKRRIVKSLEALRAKQINELKRSLREEVQEWEKKFRRTDVVRDLRLAFQEGYMDALGDVAGAHAAAVVFKAPQLPVVAILAATEDRMEETLVSTALGMSRSTGGFAYGWTLLGSRLGDLKRSTEAEEAYRRAIALDEGFAYPWNGLGNLLQDHLQR
ncbi:MAG TPA: hypothetical protein VFF61_11255, partial [Microvirga sp.]|nr:hypothetical protein [Microvirga sp.]